MWSSGVCAAATTTDRAAFCCCLTKLAIFGPSFFFPSPAADGGAMAAACLLFCHGLARAIVQSCARCQLSREREQKKSVANWFQKDPSASSHLLAAREKCESQLHAPAMQFELQQRKAKFEKEQAVRKDRALAQLARERAEQERCERCYC